MLGYEVDTTDDSLVALIERYSRSKRPIQVDFRKLVSPPAFSDRATHFLHPYPAKLLVHIPYFFLANHVLSRPGDAILDPFSGSGTVALEATLSGRVAVGADSNPFARLLTKVKTTPISSASLKSATERLSARISNCSAQNQPDVVNLSHWFYPHVIEQLGTLRSAIERTRRSDVRDFFRICFSNCVRRVSLADPRLSVPVRLKSGKYPTSHPFSVATDTKLASLQTVDAIEVFFDVVALNTKRLHALGYPHKSESTIVYDDAKNLSTNSGELLPDNSVQMAITSPPYPGAQKYIRASTFSLGWLGLCGSKDLMHLKRKSIGREEFHKAEVSCKPSTVLSSANRRLAALRKLNPVRATIAATYLNEMQHCFDEMARVIRPNGFVVLVAANSTMAGTTFRTPRYLIELANLSGFKTRLHLLDDIQSRGLMTKRNKTASVIARESVILLEKGR